MSIPRELLTTTPKPCPTTLWSVNSLALSASNFSSANTSEFPISTFPSDTWLRPVPDPPACALISTSGYFSLNFSIDFSIRGSNADEPLIVIDPL